MSAPHDHLHGHSHPHRQDDEADRLAGLAFAEGFRAASDKRAFLELTRIPQEITRDGVALKLMQVVFSDCFSVGSASPGFGGRGMVYHPLPGVMIDQTSELRFVYVSPGGREELTFAEVRLHCA